MSVETDLHDWHECSARAFERHVKYFGCARRGCCVVNPDHLAYGAYGKSWCLHHAPWRVRFRRWLGEDI